MELNKIKQISIWGETATTDSPNGYTGNVDVAFSDGSVKNFTIVNGIIKQIN